MCFHMNKWCACRAHAVEEGRARVGTAREILRVFCGGTGAPFAHPTGQLEPNALYPGGWPLAPVRAPPGQRSCVKGTMSFTSSPSAPNDCSTSPLSWRSITMLIRRVPKPGLRLRLGAGPPLSFQSSTSVSPCSVRVPDQVKLTPPPPGSDRLSCLPALLTSSCSAMLNPKVGSGLRKTFGPPNEIRSRNGASSVFRSSVRDVDLQPPSVMRRWALASARTRAWYFVTRSETLREVFAVCENKASSWENKLPERCRSSRIISSWRSSSCLR